MLIALVAVLLVVVVYGPQLWVRWVMARHATEVPGMPGTGGEFARHLLDRHGLEHVKVEATEAWSDHYDPSGPVVRLGPGNHDGKSLTAIAVAAHEVGHALQDHNDDPRFERRQRLYPTMHTLQSVGVAILGAAPVLTLLTRSHLVFIPLVLVGLGTLLCRVLMHALTLPVELDASFARALPVVTEGRYVAPGEEAAVRSVLRAAALTYLAAALADVLSIWRWLLIARGRWV